MTLPDPITIARDLVARPSVSSPDPAHDQSNLAVIDRLASFCEEVGAHVEIMKTGEGKANVIATLGPRDVPAGLILSGHTDTVPYDEGKWESDPFALTEREGRLYGLGSADMKAFFASALHAASAFDPDRLRAPIVILGTADEESTMDGVRALVAAGRVLGKRAVIGEPTSLVPVRMHKGIMMEKIRIDGRSGHSSDPALGANAIEGMHLVIDAIMKLREELGVRHRDEGFSVPEPTMNLGAISGGDSPNRICAHCELLIDVRMTPSMTPKAVRAALAEALGNALQARPDLTLSFVPMIADVPAFEVAADAAITKSSEQRSGAASRSVLFCTEAPFMMELGIESIVMGPGSIDVAHQPNEFTTRADLGRATEIYRGMIEDFCFEETP